MEKCYAYCRVSGPGQIGGGGFERQEEAIEKFALANGYDVLKIFKEQVSGTKGEAERPQFMEMVEQIMSNGVKMILVEDMTRLARLLMVQEQLIIYLASKDIDLIACNTGENVVQAIMGDPMWKAMIQMQGVFSELDKGMLVKRLNKGKARIRATGAKCEGRKAYTEVDPALIREMRRLRRRRPGRVRRTFKDIAQRLNDEGWQSRTGRPFTGNNVSQILHRLKTKPRKRQTA